MNHRKAFLTGAATPIAAAVVLAARWPRFVAWIEQRERQRALAYARTHRPPSGASAPETSTRPGEHA